MCHSENKYGDKQNKNRWACKTVDIIRETDAVTNRTRTVGALKLCIENTYNRKQNKKPLGLANHSIRSKLQNSEYRMNQIYL